MVRIIEVHEDAPTCNAAELWWASGRQTMRVAADRVRRAIKLWGLVADRGCPAVGLLTMGPDG